MAGPALAIVNPSSGGGATSRRWPDMEAALREALGALHVEHTRGPGDAARIAREAARAGANLLIVAGGDGTAREVADGLLAAGLGGRVALGLLPLGTGRDLLRGLGIPDDPGAAIARIARGALRRIDAGRIRHRTADGGEALTHFVNIASVGLSARATALASEGPRLPGGRATFLLAALRAIARGASPTVRIALDGRVLHDGPLALVAAANGPYFGGGMRVATAADPGDGLLDVVLVRGTSRARLLRRLPRVYRGAHLELDEVLVARGRYLELSSAASVPVEADGELLGTLPASVELLPGALTLRGVDR